MNLSSSSLFHPRATSICFTRAYSSLPRPYHFHVAASWAGKPHDPRDHRPFTQPFDPENPIAKWRDATLATHSSPCVLT
ncbi:hypothetical protein A0H81_04364 [Grifola frondosa]|uniref:Uncharacterized protein n=1 Tax=Grifola frondosa TaxID=5627 RepID=A0A1C7MG28_GRIFR|nr:hypothetical protein A0H81_04364 [Grifola frondosa]